MKYLNKTYMMRKTRYEMMLLRLHIFNRSISVHILYEANMNTKINQIDSLMLIFVCMISHKYCK